MVLVELLLEELVLDVDVSLVVTGSDVGTGSVVLAGSGDVVGSVVSGATSVLSSGGPSVTPDDVPAGSSVSAKPLEVSLTSVETVTVPAPDVVPVSPSSVDDRDPSIPGVSVDPPLGLGPVSEAAPMLEESSDTTMLLTPGVSPAVDVVPAGFKTGML